MKIKHIIMTRLLSIQMQYNDVLSDDQINNRLKLLSTNLIPSLNNQTDVDFEFILLVNPKLQQYQYENIISAVDMMHMKFSHRILHHDSELNEYLSKIWEQNDLVSITRIDDDDFIYKHGISTIKSLIKQYSNSNFDVIVAGYNHGYMYILGESTIQPRDFGFKHVGHMSIFQTYIYNTSRLQFSPKIHPYSISHDQVKKILIERNINPIIINLDENLDEQFVIYFRHKDAFMQVYREKKGIPLWKGCDKPIGKPIYIDETFNHKLKDIFGFDVYNWIPNENGKYPLRH